MNNTISKEFHFFSLLRFAFPTIIMMIVMGMYTIVDSLFVSNFVGTNALSAINIVYPVINMIGALAIMLASGGSAVIARKLGCKDEIQARKNFTLLIITGLLAGFVIMILGLIFMKPSIFLLGSSELLYQHCRDYLVIMLLFAPATILQFLFQTFFVTAGHPKLNLVLTVTAGLVNAVLDYCFIVLLDMGIGGAALATGIGQMIPAAAGICFFLKSKEALHFTRPEMDRRVLLESCSNGSSEMVTNMSMGVITFLFNIIMMKYLGEDGIAAITIILYFQFLMIALYMGFSMGVAPIISYNHGSGNHAQIKRLYKMCMLFIGICSVVVYVSARLLSSNVISLFSARGTAVHEIASSGIALFSFSFLFAGFNIFASAMFTAFSNGGVSAFISLMRTFVLVGASLLLLPELLGITGIWLSIPAAELLTLVISLVCFYKWRHRYHYA